MLHNNKEEKKTTIEWRKRGDFSRTFDSGGELIREVEYKNITKTPEVEIFIGGYHSGSRKIIFRSKQLINSFLNKCKENKLFVEDNFCTRNLGSTNICVASANNKDKKLLSQFLNCIDSIVPLGKKVKKEIFDTLQLPQIADEKSFYDELESLIDKGNLEEAIKKAKLTDDDHVFWRLGQLCESKQKFPEAISIYQEIDEKNIHYHEANQQAMYIIMQYLIEKERTLTKQEKQQYQEDKFRFMLRGNYQSCNQNIIDQHYHQLCGSNDFKPTITGVGCNEDTLIALANQTSSLRAENHALQQKNIEQMTEIASLKEKLKNQSKVLPYSSTLFKAAQPENKQEQHETYCGFKPGFLT